VIVTEANASERVATVDALSALLEAHQPVLDSVQVLWVDSEYQGDRFGLAVWLILQAKVDVIRRIGTEFEILPNRWIVERTFGWLNWYRRLSKEYEKLPEMSKAAIYAVMLRIMLRRLVA
jgi:putative transposase